MSSSIVIIPTYNEIENVEAIIRAVFVLQKEFHVLIVDDNSPDKTGDCVRGLQEEFKGKLFLETRLEKSGLGTAYIHGFKWAIAKGYEYIFEMDARHPTPQRRQQLCPSPSGPIRRPLAAGPNHN